MSLLRQSSCGLTGRMVIGRWSVLFAGQAAASLTGYINVFQYVSMVPDCRAGGHELAPLDRLKWEYSTKLYVERFHTQIQTFDMCLLFSNYLILMYITHHETVIFKLYTGFILKISQ